jgi:transposase-like protein
MKRRKIAKLTTGRRHMTDEQRAEAIQLYMDGATLREISKHTDRHRVILSRLFNAAGVKHGARFRMEQKLRHFYRNDAVARGVFPWATL